LLADGKADGGHKQCDKRDEDKEMFFVERHFSIVLYLRHYPALRAPVEDFVFVSSSLGKAKTSFASALAHSSALKEGEFLIIKKTDQNFKILRFSPFLRLIIVW
jgi:hypothetical protein